MNQLAHHPLHGGNLVWAAELANCSPSVILDFSASINPLGPPPSAIATIQTHLADLKAYPDPQYRNLRAALAQFHHISPDWILPGNGAAELLTWACRDLSELDTTYILTPAFGDYFRALKAFGADVSEILLGAETLVEKDGTQRGRGAGGSADLKPKLQSAIRKSEIDHRSGLLLNNPHNPTGLMFSRDDVISCLEQFELVVVDEAFMDFLPPGEEQSVIDAVQQYPNLVVVRSLTKFYSLPGLRLGYAIAHPERLQRWQQWRDPWSVNALATAVGAVIVQDREFQQQTWDWLVPTRSALYRGLAVLPGLTPSLGAANFLLVRSDVPVVELQTELLKQQQVLIRDCLSFPQLGDRYFRVAVRSAPDNQRLLTGLAKILPN